MSTAIGEAIDRVSGLDPGADEYIGRPFEPRELVARVRAALVTEAQGGTLRLTNPGQTGARFDCRTPLLFNITS